MGFTVFLVYGLVSIDARALQLPLWSRTLLPLARGAEIAADARRTASIAGASVAFKESRGPAMAVRSCYSISAAACRAQALKLGSASLETCRIRW